jgi:hypothetical protein
VKNGFEKVSHFFLLTAQFPGLTRRFFLLPSNFPRRRISRYAQIDLVFASSQRKMLNALRSLPKVCAEFTRRGEWWAKSFEV